MSIINETLNRLEMDRHGTAGSAEKNRALRAATNSRRGHPTLLAAGLLVVTAGAGLAAWQWYGQRDGSAGALLAGGGSPQVVLAEQTAVVATTQPTVDEAPVTERKSAPAANDEAQQAASIALSGNASDVESVEDAEGQSVVASTEKPETPQVAAVAPASTPARPAEMPAAAASAKPVEAVAKVSKPIQRQDNAREAKAEEKQLVAAAAKPAIAKAEVKKTTKSQPAPAAASQQQTAAAIVTSVEMRPASAVDQAVERARLAVARGEYRQAVTALDALSEAPESRADFWLLKGSAHLGLGELEAADKAFSAAQSLAPANAQIVVQRAVLKQEAGDHMGALQILREAASRHRDVPEVFLNKGYSELELGAVRDAARSFRVFVRMTEGRSLYAEQRKAISDWLSQLPGPSA